MEKKLIYNARDEKGRKRNTEAKKKKNIQLWRRLDRLRNWIMGTARAVLGEFMGLMMVTSEALVIERETILLGLSHLTFFLYVAVPST
jgi:hypothetical protein